MPGQPKRRARRLALEAAAKAAELLAAGDPGAADAAAEACRLGSIAQSLAPITPDAPSPAQEAKAARAVMHPCRESRSRKMRAARLVGGEAACLQESRVEGSVMCEAGAMAAEIAIKGVRPGFLLPPQGEAEALSDNEFTIARAVVSTSCGEGDANLSDESLPPWRWLEAAFPVLSEQERVRCARYLAVFASIAAEPPERGTDGQTVAERALAAAGLSYTAFESCRTRETQFDTSQAVVAAARKRAVMNQLEEALWLRSFEGQEDEALTRDGTVVPVIKHDNNLAFNMLKYGHEQYARQMVKDKAAANAMTLMIAKGFMPQSDNRLPEHKEPKTVEMTEANHAE